MTLAFAFVVDKHGSHAPGPGDAAARIREQVREQLTREPRPLPTMTVNPAVKDLFAFTYEDFKLEGYDPHPKISAPIAV